MEREEGSDPAFAGLQLVVEVRVLEGGSSAGYMAYMWQEVRGDKVEGNEFTWVSRGHLPFTQPCFLSY